MTPEEEDDPDEDPTEVPDDDPAGSDQSEDEDSQRVRTMLREAQVSRRPSVPSLFVPPLSFLFPLFFCP